MTTFLFLLKPIDTLHIVNFQTFKLIFLLSSEEEIREAFRVFDKVYFSFFQIGFILIDLEEKRGWVMFLFCHRVCWYYLE